MYFTVFLNKDDDDDDDDDSTNMKKNPQHSGGIMFNFILHFMIFALMSDLLVCS